jgi:ribosomal protein S12 methylthiotransferase
MLRRMQRRVSRSATEELLAKLRAQIPGLVLRTTFITGFPGETEEQFEELVEFAQAQRFERLGVFTYSFEPDTPAARLPDHLDEATKQRRCDRLMEVQQKIAFEWNAAQKGKRIDVLIDRQVPGEKQAWIGRGHADAPDVDSVVYVSGHKLAAGRIVSCEIVAASEYDLVGVAVGKPR